MKKILSAEAQSLVVKLEGVLSRVENPARYLGGEGNGIDKDFDDCVGRMVLLFPDTYEVGMSNNGSRVLYHVVNREEDLLCETSFAPWMDMADEMRQAGIPLYSHESYTPLNEFDLVGISLQTELNYTNVPYVLELSGIPSWSAERGINDPFIVGGGPVMANPEPVADFYDFFVIGDGEVLAPAITRIVGAGRRANKDRITILTELAELKGIYVPSLMAIKLNEHGEWIPDEDAVAKGSYLRTKGVQRTWVEVLNKDDYPVQNLIPNGKLVHNRFSVEVMRGCTQGCRFCQAGYWYRPNRELQPDDVIEIAQKGLKATGEKELGLLSLSTADYSQVEKVTDILIDKEEFNNIDVSLPSLRANSFGQTLAQKVAAIKGGRSATFAPETGSERLRILINKTISDDDMYQAAENVYSSGFNNIKLYTMVGLPTENLEDMEAFCGLIQGLITIGQKHNRQNKVHASIGIMVPKPFTPMQWVGFMGKEKVMTHINFVRERFRKNKNVRISWTEWDEAHLESFYSRGDRSLAPMIYEAYQSGIVFESFRENFNYAKWNEIWEKYNVNQDRIFVERSHEETFPWDFIHAGTSKGYLKSEYKKMFLVDSAPVPDCKWGDSDCQKCGIPGNGLDTQLADTPKMEAPSRKPEEVRALFHERKHKLRDNYHYVIKYSKSELAKYLPHQNTMDFFSRAFTRMNITLKFSKGFSPRPLVQNLGALPLGLGTECEEVQVTLLDELPVDGTILSNLNAVFPRGLEVLDITRVENKKLRIPEEVSYSLEMSLDPSKVNSTIWGPQAELFPKTIALFEKGELPAVFNHRGKKNDIQDEVIEMSINVDGSLFFKLKVNSSGASVSPFVAVASFTGCTIDEARQTKITKKALYFETEDGRARIKRKRKRKVVPTVDTVVKEFIDE